MRNRFEQSSPGIGRSFSFLLSVAAFLILLLLFLGGIRSVSDTTAAKQLESLQTALSRSIAQCYAVEGMYPPDLQYLKDHYGLIYDETEFLVDYESYGSNLMPEVTVLRKRK